MDWTGFSDEDLRRLKSSSASNNDTKQFDNRIRPAANLKQHPRAQRKPVRPVGDTQQQQTSDSYTAEALPPSHRLSRPKEDHTASEKAHPTPSTGRPVPIRSSASNVPESKVPMADEGVVAAKTEATVQKRPENSDPGTIDRGSEPSVELDEHSILTKELASLDRFREQQKMMEELNKRKKQMLKTAIQQRQSKAKAETEKLTRIKRELEHLDQLITTDVSVIRDRIEMTSREYLEAQKRYDRAEREYIDAKTDLHEKSEAKDLLTEHLYTVIHQNEMRKAKKLAELMNKLELETSETDGDELLDAPAPVPLCLIAPLNRLGIHGPASPSSPPSGDHVPALNSSGPALAADGEPQVESKSPSNEIQSGTQEPTTGSLVADSQPSELTSDHSCGPVDNTVTATMITPNCDAHGVPVPACKEASPAANT